MKTVLVALIDAFWHTVRVLGFAPCHCSAENWHSRGCKYWLWWALINRYREKQTQRKRKSNLMGNLGKCLGKPGDISLYTLYKTITRCRAQLLDSIKEKILTEKVNTPSEFWHSLFLMYSAAGSSLSRFEICAFIGVRVGRRWAADQWDPGGYLSPGAATLPLRG